MHKILVKIKDNTLNFSLRELPVDPRHLNNTNVINTEKMVFSDEYINENIELIESFFNLIVVKKGIDTVNVSINAIFPLVYRIIKNIPGIKNVNLLEDKNVGYISFEKLLESKYIKNVNLYSISSFMLDKLSREKDINITTRCEVLYLSNFMEINKFNTYSDIYYRKQIDIDCNIKPDDIEDINSFFRFNDKLKVINLYNLNEESIDFIFENIIKNNKKNIKIVFNQEENSRRIIKLFDTVSEKYKKVIKSNNLKLKVKYTKEYKDKNTMKQVNLTFLRLILLVFIIVSIAVGTLSYIKYNKDTDSIEDEMENINEIEGLEDLSEFEPEEEVYDDKTIKEEAPTQSAEDTKKAKQSNSPYYKKFEQTWDKLLKINNETVGWLKVKNTKINMPVTQHKDNKYYLNYSYYKKKNTHGWVFVDYRNDTKKLDQNTIFYGHRNDLGIMFGSLKNVLNKSWYTNKDNQIITFNTLDKNMKWQIFSIYTIKNTTDYLTVNFGSEKSYTDFLNKIQKRSIYNFKVKLNSDDKIITLSTCYKNSNNRLVIHAKLIK